MGLSSDCRCSHLPRLLPSGADATQSLAHLISGTVENYIIKMNELARRIGMNNTNFVNVTGLDEENHYSTASDILLLLRYALEIIKS